MRTAILVIATAAMACAPRAVFPVAVEESLFPKNWSETIALDAEVLRAVQVAANDHYPPESPWAWLFEDEWERCLWSQRALTYDIIANKNVIFVELHVDPSLCGIHSGIADNGARYAIRRADGRILQRQMWFEFEELQSVNSSAPPPTPAEAPPANSAPTPLPAAASPVPFTKAMRPPPL